MKATKIVVVITAFLILFSLFYIQQQSHAATVKILKKQNQQTKILANKEIEAQRILTDKVILDREGRIMELTSNITELEKLLDIKDKSKSIQETLNNAQTFTITAYDLSIQSCGKSRTNKGFGKTATGYNLAGQTLRSASTISTDPSIIPLGSIVYLYFTGQDKSYNGIYISSDTGSDIKGNRIDLFTGDNTLQIALNFGVKKAKVINLQ